MSNPGGRTAYFDSLRVLATFAMILLHVTARPWYAEDVSGFAWQVLNFYNCIGRWSVPVFVMISGALFLNREIPVKKIYTKYILRLVTAYFAWSFAYAFPYALYAHQDAKTVLSNTLYGHFHMWYIPMTVGLYMCVPLLQAMIRKPGNARYYLRLSFLFAFLLPQIVSLVNQFGGDAVRSAVADLYSSLSGLDMRLLFGFPFYFVCGAYVHSLSFTSRQRAGVYLAGLIGFASTIGLTAALSFKAQRPMDMYMDWFTVNAFLEAVSVFVWLKYHGGTSGKLQRGLARLAQYSFGAYLVHAMVIEVLAKLGFTSLSFNPVFAVPVLGAVVFAVSYGVSGVLNHIPFLNKYIV